MTITSQQYADLSGDAYKDRPVGVRPDRREVESIGGVEYAILEHVNNRATGYQGTVYQRVDTGEIVVAHRGTEFHKAFSDHEEALRDVVLADGGMVANRVNLQADDAIALTERAKGYAEDYGAKPGRIAPEVTITGHSLGGGLAQISAAKTGLRGETFNAYGAASLDYDIPEGGDRMLNHVMARDFVSAASPHYGQVRVYATQDDIQAMRAAGYVENRMLDPLAPDRPIPLALASINDHRQFNFTNENGPSVLSDPRTQALAQDNATAIGDYRQDIRQLRETATQVLGAPGRAGEQIQEGLERQYRYTRPPPHMPPGQSIPSGFPMPAFRPGGFGATQEEVDAAPGLATAVAHSEPTQQHKSLTGDRDLDAVLDAAMRGDDQALVAASHRVHDSPAGQVIVQQAQEQFQREEAQRQFLAQQQREQDMAQQQRGPMHSMMG